MTKEKCEFKSAEELGLHKDEWAALITILPLLEHDAIRHAPEGSHQTAYFKRDKPKPVFNMSSWNEDLACGTAMCIGGSAEFFGKLAPHQIERRAERLSGKGNHALHNLFYPSNIDGWDRLTPQQAAVALRHYLTTGQDGGWEKATKGTGQ